MNETYGLLDMLEALVVDGFRLPLGSKVIVDEDQILDILDKIRHSIKSGGKATQNIIDQGRVQETEESIQLEAGEEKITISLLEKEESKAKQIKKDSNVYADQVMANLQLMVTKMQTNLVKFENSIEEGRKRISELESERKESHDTTRQ